MATGTGISILVSGSEPAALDVRSRWTCVPQSGRSSMKRYGGLIGTALACAAMCMPAQAQRPAWEQAGTLNCDVSAGIGFVVGSQRTVNCLFTPNYQAPPEQYVGTITKVGLDIGVTGGGQLVWSVLQSTSRRRGALAGSYTGASAEATVGAGLGANVLVGGNDRSVALQPLSIQGQVGLNIAAGIAEIALQFVR
jgi:hypothetical protein